MIAVVSYGVGNVRAFARIYERHGFEVSVTDSPDVLRNASHLILPGVGAFDSAVQRLQLAGLREVLDDLVCSKRRPVLGVCVGMQMMLDGSDEGVLRGLGWIGGNVRRLGAKPGLTGLPLPHMGWNDVACTADPLFEGIPADANFYFLHSFYAQPGDSRASIAEADYGTRFSCAVRKGSIVGVQFHPEKSHQWGERLLVNFARS